MFFFDWCDRSKPRIRYYLYYEVYDRTFHMPVTEKEAASMDLPQVRIPRLQTEGKDVHEIVSSQFVSRIEALIDQGDFTYIETMKPCHASFPEGWNMEVIEGAYSREDVLSYPWSSFVESLEEQCRREAEEEIDLSANEIPDEIWQNLIRNNKRRYQKKKRLKINQKDLPHLRLYDDNEIFQLLNMENDLTINKVLAIMAAHYLEQLDLYKMRIKPKIAFNLYLAKHSRDIRQELEKKISLINAEPDL